MISRSPTPNHLEWARKIALEHHEAISRYALGICRNRERAEDAVQETYLRLLKQDRRKIESHIKPWLLRVCRSRILDMARKEGRMTMLNTTIMDLNPANAPLPDERAQNHDLAHALMSFVEHLTPAQQEVLRLKFQSGLSYKEIAEVTDKSVNHVGVTLHQALKRLKALVGESGEILFNELTK
jgi:RNA polymerase sigma factor (sigma-70 family)